MRLVQLALPHLLKSDQGRIVLISSLAVREPSPHLVLTNSVRPGVVGYMKSLANELGVNGITVNSVGPDGLATPRLTELYGPGGPPTEDLARIPARRLGEPRELGDLVALPLLGPRLVHQRHAHPGRRGHVPRAALMRRLLTPFRLAVGAVVVLLVAAFVLWLVPSNSYIFLPDRRIPSIRWHVQAGRSRRAAGSTSSTSSSARRR